MNDTLINLLISIPPLLLAVILHEIGHGLMAEKFGDSTARNLGRITLNPLKHIDFTMTILLPTILVVSGSPVVFGGAKPVPVNFSSFKEPRKAMLWVALAGPIVNFLLMGGSLICYWIWKMANGNTLEDGTLVGTFITGWLLASVIINLVLALFNLIPIPPLDGGRVAVSLLPLKQARSLARLEPYGFFILFGLLYLGMVDAVLRPALHLVLSLL